MNILSIDLTQPIHYISVLFSEKKYSFTFEEDDTSRRNDWFQKIDHIYNQISDFDIEKINANLYIAGPGSYTGARLAYTFLSSIEYLNKTPFYAISNLTAILGFEKNMIPILFGNKSDIFYQINGKDLYSTNLQEITALNTNLIGIQDDFKVLNKVIDNSRLASIAIDLFLDNKENALNNNFPNYIKELNYTKTNG